jgi:hypothetical protein
MSKYAADLKKTENCGQDFTVQNPIVIQAYDGLSSYSVMAQAGCLKDTNGSYCFADAITGLSSVVDSYLYYLPLGTNLPTNSQPSCSACVQDVMSVFAGAAKSSSQVVSKTYGAAAAKINSGCGANFVNSSIKSAAPRHAVQPIVSMFIAALVGYLLA